MGDTRVDLYNDVPLFYQFHMPKSNLFSVFYCAFYTFVVRVDRVVLAVKVSLFYQFAMPLRYFWQLFHSHWALLRCVSRAGLHGEVSLLYQLKGWCP